MIINYIIFLINLNLILIVKNLDLLDTNSQNTFDKTINSLFNLYTDYQNDTVNVDYGDSITQQIQLRSSIIKF